MEKWGKQVPKSRKNRVWDNKTWFSRSFAWQFQIWEHLHNFQSRAHLLCNLKFVPKRLSPFEIKPNFWTSHWISIPYWLNRLNAVKYPWVKWNGIDGRVALVLPGRELGPEIWLWSIKSQGFHSGNKWLFPLCLNCLDQRGSHQWSVSNEIDKSSWSQQMCSGVPWSTSLVIIGAPECSWDLIMCSWGLWIAGDNSLRSFALEHSGVLCSLAGFCWVDI